MARTPLFGAMQRTLHVRSGPSALSRRSFLVMSAALAACRPIPHSSGASIGIVGGGGAGLTIAYRLARAGKAATLYEASDRWGGRMFTRRGFNEDGQFCEMGGELVDTNHTALRNLAGELGIAIDRLSTNDAVEDLYHIGGRLYAQHDMADAQGRGAFARIAQRIAADQAALLQNDEWTERARALDQMSIRAYLDTLTHDAPPWAISLLDLAYLGEYGLPTSAQSALNLIDLIGAAPNQRFEMFGESDEAFRIHGGSSTLTDALATRLGGNITQAPKHVLTAIAKTERGLRLSFDGPNGAVTAEHDIVVLALPFTKLRQVTGIDQLGLTADKLKAIRELGYGDNAKLMVSTKNRPWSNANAGLPAPSSGEFYSDRFQVVWETSRAQQGARGVLTNFLSGQQDQTAALAAMTQGLAAFSPATAESLDSGRRAWIAWERQPFTLGSYASAKVGQYTTLLEETATPALDGRLQFAGEHTSADFLGYMNGAVESGERVAAALLSR